MNQIIVLDLVHTPKKTWDVMKEVLEKMENYLDEHLKTFAQPVLRLLEKEDEMTHYDLKTHFSDISLPVDLREFVEMGGYNRLKHRFDSLRSVLQR